ncbi:hypothetical protein ACH4FX_10280 [Streptomyces sp. NPDC018019]|uniref:hypothetical protein n=1 Tax=Streptomyces sp. NPDC018019 TaxID=3365030 RepID=UPI0037A2E97D
MPERRLRLRLLCHRSHRGHRRCGRLLGERLGVRGLLTVRRLLRCERLRPAVGRLSGGLRAGHRLAGHRRLSGHRPAGGLLSRNRLPCGLLPGHRLPRGLLPRYLLSGYRLASGLLPRYLLPGHRLPRGLLPRYLLARRLLVRPPWLPPRLARGRCGLLTGDPRITVSG